MTVLKTGLSAILLAAIANPHSALSEQPGKEADMAGSVFQLSSSAFGQKASIPERYTCEGGEESPPLAWAGAPAGTKSFALIVDDPDAPDPRAPKMTWVHWVLYNLPPTTDALAEG